MKRITKMSFIICSVVSCERQLMVSILNKRSYLHVYPSFLQIPQWAFGAKLTSYQRRCDVIMSHRR